MPRRFEIPVPRDFLLRRDLCSYGYFLLWPNHWDVASHTYTTALVVPSGPVLLAATQGDGVRARRGQPLLVEASRSLLQADCRDASEQIARVLRLDEPPSAIRAFHALDPRWRSSGRGRLMRSPSLFEDVIKTVTSCNVQWPSTVVMNRRLCEVLGPRAVRAGPVTHAFPSAAALARARPSTLRARCRCGYRDERIVELARIFHRGEIDASRLEDPATPDEIVHAHLLDLPGIGPYAAANIMQLLGRYARLPLDTESVRHGKTVLGMTGSDRSIMRRLHDHYAPMREHAFRSYWFELWQFYESRRGPAWTWDRDTTGTTFTASQLKPPAAVAAEASRPRKAGIRTVRTLAAPSR